MQTFSVCHVLICASGGLVVTRHNKIHYDIIYLAKQAFSPNFVHRKTLIHQGRRISEEEVCHRGSVPEICGDVSIRGLSKIMMEAIIYVRFGDDYVYYWNLVRIYRLL